MIANKKILEGIIRCPACQSVGLEEVGSTIRCPVCSLSFPVENGVPLLIAENKTAGKQSEIHRAFGSTFEYIGHYRRDALEYDYFKERHGAVRHSERRLREYISSKVPKVQGLILDVGCGGAWVAKSFCPKGYKTISFDISPKNTQEALKRYPSENHAAVVGDVFSLPFREKSFNYVIASEIIEHVTEPETLVKNVFSILKPGGTLFVSSPYKEKIEYSLCVHCNRPTPKSAHLHSFDEKILTSLYQGADLAEVKYYTFGNKALAHLHTHTLLKHFCFGIWKQVDRLANFFYRRPLSIIVKWQKKEE